MNVMTADEERPKEKSTMATFTIDPENNIVCHADAPNEIDNVHLFTSEKEFAKIAAEWSVSRLVEIWNSFAGVAPFDELKPVKKFTSRNMAISRIWQAIARLSPTGRAISRKGAEGHGQGQETRYGAHRRERIAHQQEGGGDRPDEARQGRNTG
jgi:hypothetical protein